MRISKNPLNTKCRVTDRYSGWYIYLPFGFKTVLIGVMVGARATEPDFQTQK
jgi:hypothetical protein